MTEARVTSGILQDDALDRVRDVLQFVQSLFDLVDDVLPPEQELRRVLGVEAVEVRSGVAVEPVPLVLQLVDPDTEGPQRPPGSPRRRPGSRRARRCPRGRTA